MTGLDFTALGEAVRSSWCGQVGVRPAEGGRLLVSTPFEFDDGDSYSIYVEASPSGGLRVTDCGATFLRLSYVLDLDLLQEGARSDMLRRVLGSGGVHEDDGQLVIDCVVEDLGRALAAMTRTITRITDLDFLNQVRVQATFYEDLGAAVRRVVPGAVARYLHPGIPHAEDYPIDWMIPGRADPLFVLGIPHQDKARLATIVLQHFLRHGVPFDSILVFDDQARIPRPDLARLSNVGGEQVSSLDAFDDLDRKIRRRAAVPA